MSLQRWGLSATIAAVIAGAWLGARPALAEHFDIQLTLRTPRGQAQASWDTSPPEGGFNARQSVVAAAGDDLTLDWSLRSAFPHGTMKAVTIRIFAAPEGAIGQKALPLPSAPRVFDNSFTTDFLPNHSARGVLHFRVTQPGNYLIRLESEGTIKEHGHEHFAALDLKVE